MTALVEPQWAQAKRRADSVRMVNAELRRSMKDMPLAEALYVAAEVLENPSPEQGALTLYRLLKMVPRFREPKMRRMVQRARIETWDRRLRELTVAQRLALACQMRDHAEGHWRG